jgi:class 3 adenylate cyclase
VDLVFNSVAVAAVGGGEDPAFQTAVHKPGRRRTECLRAAGLCPCEAVAVAAPTGTVTFVFTDIEGSTRLWDEYPAEMRTALARHDGVVRAAIEANNGYVFATGGDGFAAAFQRVGDALRAAVSAQGSLGEVAWPEQARVTVRMGLHTGEAEEQHGDYVGSAVNRAARTAAVVGTAAVVAQG